MSREWWGDNWVTVVIGTLIVAGIVASVIWPDSNLGCSVHIESKAT